MSSRRRNSIRLPHFDYTTPGAYFVTVCAFRRQNLFGYIGSDGMHLNETGQMIQSVWNGLIRYDGVETDEFVVMPDHVHGIIMLNQKTVGAGPCACPQHHDMNGQPQGVAPTVFSLPDIVHRFKSMTTARYRLMNPAASKLWQRNYYEHVIRNDSELNELRTYIRNNPTKSDLSSI